MNWVYEHLVVGFGILKFLYKLRYTNKPCVLGSSYWRGWPKKFTRIPSIEYEEKNRSRGAWKRGDWCKKMNEKSTVCFWCVVHTDMINLFYENFRFQLGVNSCLDMFSRKKYFFMVCYSLLDSKVIGKRYLKFPFNIRELLYKLRIGKKKTLQNSIYPSLSGRLIRSF